MEYFLFTLALFIAIRNLPKVKLWWERINSSGVDGRGRPPR
jgi:hypothetical protein